MAPSRLSNTPGKELSLAGLALLCAGGAREIGWVKREAAPHKSSVESKGSGPWAAVASS